MTELVVSVLGEDRPGILDDMCGVVQANSGHITDLHVIDAGGHFAMISTVRIAKSAVAPMREQLVDLAAVSGLIVRVEPALAHSDAKGCHTYRFVGETDDYPSLLKPLTHLLRVLRINIENIETQHDQGSSLHLTLNVPRNCPVTQLREYLCQLLGPLKVDWKLLAL
ncbi:MAG: glycine cleavage system protein R [Tepidisphaeraceae bacterium]